MLKGWISCVVLSLAPLLSSAQDLKSQEAALNVIAEFANKLCTQIPVNGSQTDVEVSGKVQAEVKGLLKQLADLGVDGQARYKSSKFQGLVQQDLLSALKNSDECRLKVWGDLKNRLLPVKPAAGESKEKQSQATPRSARRQIASLGLQYTPDDFVKAAKLGDNYTVQLYLDAGMNPDATDENGDTALSVAAFAGQVVAVRYLLKAGADPNRRPRDDIDDNSPLRSAAKGGSAEIVRELLSRHIDKELVNAAFVAAATHRHHEIMRILAGAGAAADMQTVGLAAIKELADGTWNDAETKDTTVIILELGANPNSATSDGTTALIFASLHEQPLTVAALLDAGAAVNVQCSCPNLSEGRGWTALLIAAAMGREEVVDVLLSRGADVNQRNDSGESALFLAVKSYSLRMTQSIVSRGVDVNAATRSGETPLMRASAGIAYPDGVVPLPELVQLLLDKGADPNARDNRGSPVLRYALYSKSSDIVLTLIGGGARIYDKDPDGKSILDIVDGTFDGEERSKLTHVVVKKSSTR